jgi:DNA-directed RNA polymerase subunit RPC12/RpoP
MKKITIDLNAPLPSTEKAMRERVEQLQTTIATLQYQLKLLIGSGLPIGPAPKYHCVRCGNTWQKKRYVYAKPVNCNKCNSRYWERPRIYEKHTRVKIADQPQELPQEETLRTIQRGADSFMASLAPPPKAPLSLAERLASACAYVPEQQPAAETESDTSCLAPEKSMNNTEGLSTGPASDGADQPTNESEDAYETAT